MSMGTCTVKFVVILLAPYKNSNVLVEGVDNDLLVPEEEEGIGVEARTRETSSLVWRD